MITVFIPCLTRCSRTASFSHKYTREDWQSMVRRRKPLKPAPARQPPVSKLHEWPSRSALFTAAVTVTALGLILVRAVGKGNWRERISSLSVVNEAKREQAQRVTAGTQNATAPVFGAVVVEKYNHDVNAFTQGLLWHNGDLYESTGLKGRSSVRRLDLETGAVQESVRLHDDDFGEGLCLLGERGEKLMQVLWKTGKGYIYDRHSLEQLSSFAFEGDGWGLATQRGHDEIYLSDGSSTIRVYRILDNDENTSFTKVREFIVYDGSRPVGLLNELEVIDGELWANVWYSDFIARIDMESGVVQSWVDLRRILDKADIPTGHDVDVLNGIAHDAQTGRIFVTGKLWPKLFSIRVTQKIAEDVASVENAFFLDPEQVAYVHENVLG